MWILKFWDSFEEQAGGLFLLLAVLLVFVQIVLRAGFGIGLSGIFEFAAFCSTFSVFLTASLGVKRNTHIRVDLISNIVPRRIAFAIEIVVQMLMLVVSLTLLYAGYLLIEESILLGEHSMGTIDIPMWIPQLIMPLAGLLLTLRTIERFVHLIRAGVSSIEPASSELPVT